MTATFLSKSVPKLPPKLLIANRGEIACRVVRTAKRMGIASVAVYSDGDCAALHVKCCDEAIALGGTTASESYLNIEKILRAAKRCGAQMIHPGYGFLSENADFAEQCQAAKLTFIGPSADSIRTMGDKSAARRAMASANIPLLTGYEGEQQAQKHLQQQANKIGYPLLIKAVAGGGGKGLRMVEAKDDFLSALESVKRESRAAFADARVMLEKFLAIARHIEVQIFADQHGNIVHLYERDCSLQRRHQKIIEESPAFGISDDLRAQMTHAAMECARAVDYVGAGTVEFLLAADNQFYFMEMNTRLQVEHPVTEMVTGQDLVEWQIRVARGEPLPCSQAQLSLSGHAIEARIYAENPCQQFLPATGKVHFIHYPDERAGAQAGTQASTQASTQLGIRVDTGVQAGDVIDHHYDPMLCKLIVAGKSRQAALDKMSQALADYQLLGVHNNISFLGNLIKHRLFQKGTTETRFVEKHYRELIEYAPIDIDRVLALACCYQLTRNRDRQINKQRQQSDRWSPWSLADGWHNNLPRTLSLHFAHQSDCQGTHEATHWVAHIEFAGAKSNRNREHSDINLLILTLPNGVYATQYQMSDAHHIQVKMDGGSVVGVVAKSGDQIMLHTQGRNHHLKLSDRRFQQLASDQHSGAVHAPMPGLVISVTAQVGEKVSVGSPLLIIEAMKMEHQITAAKDGVVKQLNYAVGDQVKDGDPLLVIE